MHVILHILFGLIVGIVAKLLYPGHDPGGIVVTAILGMAGAFVAGLIGRALGWYKPGHPAGFGMAVLGAIVLLVIYHAAAGDHSRRATLTDPPGIYANVI